MQDFDLFTQLANDLLQHAGSKASVAQIIKGYAQVSLEALEKIPELASFQGEKEKYPHKCSLVLREELNQASKYVAQHLATVIATEGMQSRFSSEKVISLLNGLLLDYFSFESAREKNQLWSDKEDFIESVVELFLYGAIVKKSKQILPFHKKLSLASNTTAVTTATQIYQSKVDNVEDLPINLVNSILQRAKEKGRQEYALVYVLFAAGLSTEEALNLERSHLFREGGQHIVQINRGTIRQIPLNQWILGKRYGFPHSDPLTQWLKTHKDEQLALFINERQQPLSEEELRALWQTLTTGLLTPQARPPRLEQARQTWCVEMLMKGISLENLSILSGIEVEQLQLFAQRAKEKVALKKAYCLNQQNNQQF